MVQTVKFSQFVQGGVLTSNGRPVGLENGNNTIWDFAGGGGSGGGVTQTITQNGHGLAIRNWVKIDTSGLYIRAQGNTADADDVIGVVISVAADGNSFVLQQSGYITTAQAVFSGLVPGDNYFLDTAVAGNMVNVDVTGDGEVSRPVFAADTPTSGWVLPYRGIIADGGPDTGSSGGGSGGGNDIVTVSSNAHGLNLGDVVRIDSPNLIFMQPVYIRGLGDIKANAQTVGVVIEVINANQFRLQFSGYNLQTVLSGGNTGGITVDDTGAPLSPATIYYLSPTVPGKVTAIEPFVSGQISKPVYACEQTFGTTGVNAGYILDQRPFAVSGTPTPPLNTIVQTTSPAPFETSSSGWIDTGICATITTTTALQRVMIMGNLNLASDGSSGVAYRIARNGVPIDIGDAAGTRERAGGSALGQPASLDSGISVCEVFYDTPGAAGIYTYCFEVNRGNSSLVGVNRSTSNTDPDSPAFFRTASSLILWIV